MTLSPIAVAIIAAEVAFWLLIVAGLAVRYVGAGGVVTTERRRRSRAILALIPALDVFLILAVAEDVYRGAEVGRAHLMAGIYLGVTMAFGDPMIAWADRKAAGLAGAKASPAPASGLAKELRDFGRWLFAAAIAVGVTATIAATVATESQATALFGILPTLGVVTVIWLVAGPVWEFVKGSGKGKSR